MQREAGKNGGGIALLNPVLTKLSQSSLNSHQESSFYLKVAENQKVETDGVDINDLGNTSMTDINQSGYGVTTSAKQKSRPEISTNKIIIDYNHNCDIAKLEKLKLIL